MADVRLEPVIFDPELQVTVSYKDLATNCDYSPFDGTRVTGWPVTTLLRGNVIVRDRQFDGAVRLVDDVTVNFFPWGSAQATAMNLDDGHEIRQISVLPTGIVEVGP